MISLQKSGVSYRAVISCNVTTIMGQGLNGLSEAKGFSLLSLALSCERKVTACLFYCSSLFPLFSSMQINLSFLPAAGENIVNV